MKPTRNRMVDNRDATSGYKIERKRQHRERQIITSIREFFIQSLSRPESHKSNAGEPKSAAVQKKNVE
jgi:hypothetical protein